MGNKINGREDKDFIRENLQGFPVLGYISQNAKIAEADRRGISPYDIDETVRAEIAEIIEALEGPGR